jgi:aerobic-type carbon monoxide dehydrogenase small subunit (CoxS/CutS family)
MDALLQLDHHAPRLGPAACRDHVEQVVPRLIGGGGSARAGQGRCHQVPVLDDGREILSCWSALLRASAADAWRGLDEQQHRLSIITEKALYTNVSIQVRFCHPG